MLSFFKSKETREERFWNWVSKNIDKIKNIRDGSDPMFAKANDKIKEYSEGLVFEVSGNEVVVSADGDKKYFDDVINLCAAAPKDADYKITGFRRPIGFLTINYNGIEIDSDDVYFEYEIRGGKVDLKLYHEDYSEETQNDIGGALFIILDHGVGEYNVEMKLGYIEFLKLEDTTGLLQLKELTEIVESLD